MKRSLASVCMSGPIEQKMHAAAGAGYDGIEIFEPDLTVSPIAPTRLADMASDLGLVIVCLQPLRDFEGAPAATRDANLARAYRKVDLAVELGTDLLCIPSSTANDVTADRGRMAADIAELAQYADAAGVRLAYEALSWGTRIRDAVDAWDVVTRVDHPAVGLLLDSYHFFVRDNAMSTIDDIDGSRVFLVQLADAPRFVMDTVRHSRHLRLFPGQGDYPIVEFVRRIRATGFDGWLSHEIFNDEFRAAPPERTARDGYRSLTWLDEQLSASAPSAPGPVRVIEITGPGAKAIGELLGRTGTHVTHRGRGSTAFRWGHATIVCETNGHGGGTATVRTIGFTPSPTHLSSLIDRVATYRTDGSTRPGEWTLSTIGHTRIIAIDDLDRWLRARGLVAIERNESHGAGFVGVDEIAFGVDSTEVAPAVLSFRAMLGTEPVSRVEFVDPGGLTSTTDLIDADETLRLRVQSTHGTTSRAGRFIDASGSGVLHVALAVDDITTVAAGLPAELVLDIPDNYYNDLSSRHHLDSAAVGELRRQHVLLERSNDGDLRRVVCQPAEGISIGFVERRGFRGLPDDSEAAVAAALLRRRDARPAR